MVVFPLATSTTPEPPPQVDQPREAYPALGATALSTLTVGCGGVA